MTLPTTDRLGDNKKTEKVWKLRKGSPRFPSCARFDGGSRPLGCPRDREAEAGRLRCVSSSRAFYDTRGGLATVISVPILFQDHLHATPRRLARESVRRATPCPRGPAPLKVRRRGRAARARRPKGVSKSRPKSEASSASEGGAAPAAAERRDTIAGSKTSITHAPRRAPRGPRGDEPAASKPENNGRVHLSFGDARGRGGDAHGRGGGRRRGARAARSRGLPRLLGAAAEGGGASRPSRAAASPARRPASSPATSSSSTSSSPPSSARASRSCRPSRCSGAARPARACGWCSPTWRTRSAAAWRSRRPSPRRGRSSRASTRPRFWRASARARSTTCSRATSPTCGAASKSAARFAARSPTRSSCCWPRWAWSSFLTVYVVPRMSSLFEGFNTELPAVTALVIGGSNFFAGNFYWLIPTFFGAVIALGIWWATPERQARHRPHPAEAAHRQRAHQAARHRAGDAELWRRCWRAASRSSSRGRSPPRPSRTGNCAPAARRRCR